MNTKQPVNEQVTYLKQPVNEQVNAKQPINEHVTYLYNRRDEVKTSLLAIVHGDFSIMSEDGLGAATRLLVELHLINADLDNRELLQRLV